MNDLVVSLDSVLVVGTLDGLVHALNFSSGETIEMAVPPLPPRAVRPTRCLYTGNDVGKSKLITAVTSQKSTPRETPNSASASDGPSRFCLRLRFLPESLISKHGSETPAARPCIRDGSSVAMRMSKSPRLKA